MKRCWKCGSIMKEGTTYDGIKARRLIECPLCHEKAYERGNRNPQEPKILRPVLM